MCIFWECVVALVSTVFYSDLLDLTAKMGVANC
jgi:hypothetical protein